MTLMYRLTGDIQMLQVGTTGDQLGYGRVGDVRATVELDVRQFRTPPGQRRQALVGYLRAVAEEQPLHVRTRARPGAATQPAQHAPHRLVAAGVLAAQRDRAPQHGLPRKVLPSVTHGRARAKVRAAEVREDLEHQLIAEPIEVRDDGRPGLRPPVFGGRRMVQRQVGAATSYAAAATAATAGHKSVVPLIQTRRAAPQRRTVREASLGLQHRVRTVRCGRCELQRAGRRPAQLC